MANLEHSGRYKRKVAVAAWSINTNDRILTGGARYPSIGLQLSGIELDHLVFVAQTWIQGQIVAGYVLCQQQDSSKQMTRLAGCGLEKAPKLALASFRKP